MDVCSKYMTCRYSGSYLYINNSNYSAPYCIGNGGRAPFRGTITFEAESQTSNDVYTIYTYNRTTDLKPGYLPGFSAMSFASVPAGHYHVKAYYKNTGQAQRQPVRFAHTQEQYIDVTVDADHKITSAVVPLRYNIGVTGAEMPSTFYCGHATPMKFYVHSDSRRVEYGYIAPVVYSVTSSAPAVATDADQPVVPTATTAYTRVAELPSVICDVYPGDNELSLAPKVPSSLGAGTYKLRFEQVLGQSVNGDTIHVPMSDYYDMTVSADPGIYGTLTGSFSILNSNNVDWYGIQVQYSITNPSGYFDKGLKFWIFPSGGGSSLGGVSTDPVYIGPGETKTGTFKLKWPDAKGNTSYRGRLDYLNPAGTSWVSLASSQPFTTKGTTGIEDIEEDAGDIVATEYYDLQGRRVASEPQPGIYLRRDRRADGTVTTIRVAR